MPFFKSMPEDAGPANVFAAHPQVYGHWTQMGQALMNGPSPLTAGEREMIAAFVVRLADCEYASRAHSAAAYAWGIEEGLIEKLVADLKSAPIEERFRPLLHFVRKLTLEPNGLTQRDADAVFAAGWDEKGLHDAIAVTARMLFMSRIVLGHGFTPMSEERARENAKKRVQLGYVNLYPDLAKRVER